MLGSTGAWSLELGYDGAWRLTVGIITSPVLWSPSLRLLGHILIFQFRLGINPIPATADPSNYGIRYSNRRIEETHRHCRISLPPASRGWCTGSTWRSWRLQSGKTLSPPTARCAILSACRKVALDYIPKVGLNWIGNVNELNAGIKPWRV